MDFKKAFRILQKEPVFTKWKKQYTHAYLVTFFTEMNEQLALGIWRVGFYDAKSDKIATFTVDTQVFYEPPAEAFKKPGALQELHPKKVKISAEKARDAVLVLQKEKYVQHLVQKGFLILQGVEQGVVWNVTLLTRTFAALNVKVDAVNGEVIEHQLMTFFDLKEK